jgi:hypothetical protein
MQRRQRVAIALLSVSGALWASSCVQSPDPSSETSTEAAPDPDELVPPEALGEAQEPSEQAARTLRQLKDALPRWHAYRYPSEHPRGEWTAHLLLAREGDLENWVDVEIQDLHSFRLFHRKYPRVPLLGLLRIALELDEGGLIPAFPVRLRMDDSGHPSDGGGFFPGGSGFSGGGTAGKGPGGPGSPHTGNPHRRGGWTPPRGAKYPPGIYPPGVKPPPPTLAERQRAVEEQKPALLRSAVRAWSRQVQEDVDHMLANAARNREEFREELRTDPDCMETCKGLVDLAGVGVAACGGVSVMQLLPQARLVTLMCGVLTGLGIIAGWKQVPDDILKWCKWEWCEPPSGHAPAPGRGAP